MPVGSLFLNHRNHYEALPVARLLRSLGTAPCLTVGRAAQELAALSQEWAPLPVVRQNDLPGVMEALAAFINQAPRRHPRHTLIFTDLDLADLLLANEPLLEAVANFSPRLLMPAGRFDESFIAWWGPGFSFSEQNETGFWRWTDCDPVQVSWALKCPEADPALPTFLVFELLSIGAGLHEVEVSIDGKVHSFAFAGSRKFAVEIPIGTTIEVCLASNRAPHLSVDNRKLGLAVVNMGVRQADGTVLLSPDKIYGQLHFGSEYARRETLHRAGFAFVRSRWCYPGGLFADIAGPETRGTPEIGLSEASREALFRAPRPPGDPECWFQASWLSDDVSSDAMVKGERA